jgi:hypothetical protein
MAKTQKVDEKQDIQALSIRSAASLPVLLCALIFAIVAVGFAIFGIGTRTAAQHPAVLAWPSVAPGVPPPAPETTTGKEPRSFGQAACDNVRAARFAPQSCG